MPIIEPDPAMPDPRAYPILRSYSRGEISAADAAYEIQTLDLPLLDDPSASEVILWSKALGFGIPSPSREEAEAEAERVLQRAAERRAEERSSTRPPPTDPDGPTGR